MILIRKFRYRILPGISVFLVYCLFPRLAYCYVDPDNGSIVFQVLISAVLSTVFSIGTFWKRIRLIRRQAPISQR